MSYPKGKDGKIKNIEQLDNIENRGIEIRYKTDKPEAKQTERAEKGYEWNLIVDNVIPQGWLKMPDKDGNW